MTLDEAREGIGRHVVYQSWTNIQGHRGRTEQTLVKAEDGVITSVNDTFVFVRYTGEQSSKATYPQDIEFLF